MQDTRPLLFPSDFPPVRRRDMSILQVNLGYKCNLSCVHCHVNAGPHRREQMDAAVVRDVVQALDILPFKILDLTGGAPELHPQFRELCRSARRRGIEVIDRCNLTILLEEGQEFLAEFLAEQQVTVVASLPCYLEENVEQQRGKGVYDKSIEALRILNGLGYGRAPELQLNLVYNPIGPQLPPSQQNLEQDYKRELNQRYGLVFNRLYTIANMPINRFGAVLLATGEFNPYMRLLRDNYNEATLDTLMCRETVSVDWRGFLYDCDFNQMLNLPIRNRDQPAHLRELIANRSLSSRRIETGEHCYGCTAGHGSSCGGALAE